MAYRPPQYAYTTAPHAPHMVSGTTNTVAYAGHAGMVHGDGVIHPNVDGVYVTENYVGPVSTILGCVLLGPFLCPLVFLCPCDTRTRFIPSTIQIPQPGGYNQQQYQQQQQQYYGGGQYAAPNVIVVGQPTTPTKGGASGATTTATTTTGTSSSYYPTL